jgi:hypothetical protein
MKTTLNKIRIHGPCADGWTKLLAHLSKTQADDEPLDLLTVLDSNGLDDTLWCFRAVDGHDREIRLFGVWCARQVQHLMTDQRSIDALDVSERFAKGHASIKELDAAKAAARAAARAAAVDAAGAATWVAARAAARAAAGAAWDAARAAAGAARDAAGAAAKVKQEEHLREILKECGK